MAPVKSCGTRLNSNVNEMQPSEIFKNESGAGACVYACVWATERYGRVGCDLFADTRKTDDGIYFHVWIPLPKKL